MTIFLLKILAMITMTMDHVATGFLDKMPAMRIVGRLAFLFYAFMIAEGFNHIKDKPDRLLRHVIKLGVLCVVSELAYDFFETGKLIDWESQSVMPVLFLGFVGLVITEKFFDKPWIYVLFYIASAFATYYGKTNYKFAGVLLIYAFYFYLKYAGNKSFAVKLLILITILGVYFIVYVWARTGFKGFGEWLEMYEKVAPWIIGHAAAAVFLAAYNGKPGPRNKVFGWVYSLYYPLHMAVLGIVLIFVGR